VEAASACHAASTTRISSACCPSSTSTLVLGTSSMLFHLGTSSTLFHLNARLQRAPESQPGAPSTHRSCATASPHQATTLAVPPSPRRSHGERRCQSISALLQATARSATGRSFPWLSLPIAPQRHCNRGCFFDLQPF
jgi:hypothetical protein